jgi:hypothetical protein
MHWVLDVNHSHHFVALYPDVRSSGFTLAVNPNAQQSSALWSIKHGHSAGIVPSCCISHSQACGRRVTVEGHDDGNPDASNQAWDKRYKANTSNNTLP